MNNCLDYLIRDAICTLPRCLAYSQSTWFLPLLVTRRGLDPFTYPVYTPRHCPAPGTHPYTRAMLTLLHSDPQCLFVDCFLFYSIFTLGVAGTAGPMRF